jgi:hypothetical protein
MFPSRMPGCTCELKESKSFVRMQFYRRPMRCCSIVQTREIQGAGEWQGHEVIVLDNMFTGSRKNIQHWIGHPHFTLVVHDVIGG